MSMLWQGINSNGDLVIGTAVMSDDDLIQDVNGVVHEVTDMTEYIEPEETISEIINCDKPASMCCGGCLIKI